MSRKNHAAPRREQHSKVSRAAEQWLRANIKVEYTPVPKAVPVMTTQFVAVPNLPRR